MAFDFTAGNMANMPQWLWPSGSNWAQEVATEAGPGAEAEQGAYQTAYGPLAADPNFGRVAPGAVSGYYDLAQRRAEQQAQELTNQEFGERGYAPQRVGPRAELTSRRYGDIGIARAGAELGVAQEAARLQAGLRQGIGQSRYGALTRGGTRTVNRSGFQGGGAGSSGSSNGGGAGGASGRNFGAPWESLAAMKMRMMGIDPNSPAGARIAYEYGSATPEQFGRGSFQGTRTGSWGAGVGASSIAGISGPMSSGQPTAQGGAPIFQNPYSAVPETPRGSLGPYYPQTQPYISLSDRVRSGSAY